MNKRIRLFSLIIGMSVVLTSHLSFANGFKILGVKSTKATAMGEAFIVQADDPSAIAFNPAGLVQLEGTQLTVGATVTNGWIKHISPAGVEEENKDKWQVVPDAFITSDLGKDNLVIGLGVTLPNGLSSDWGETGFARYVATYSDILVADINPSIACKLTDKLSVGMGLSYYYSEAVLESMIDYGNLVGLPGLLDGKSKLKGSGDTVGYNVGVLYNLNEKHGFAATFKSPYSVEYNGKAKLYDIPAFMGLGAYFESEATTSIDFPAVVVLGYAYRPIDKLKLEFNLDWTDWSTLNSLSVDYDSPALTDTEYKYEYRDTFAYKFGLEYSVTDSLKLRAGYIYNENATPERNFRPSLPDTNNHFVCSGFGYKVGNFDIDGAVQAIFYEDRTVDNNVDNNEILTSSSIDGKYENFALGFSLGVTYRF